MYTVIEFELLIVEMFKEFCSIQLSHEEEFYNDHKNLTFN